MLEFHGNEGFFFFFLAQLYILKSNYIDVKREKERAKKEVGEVEVVIG